MDRPQFRIQVKMKRVREGIERWHSSGKDPSAVGKLMEGAQPLANSGKLDELEKLVDQAIEMLGETEKVPDVYRQKLKQEQRGWSLIFGTCLGGCWQKDVVHYGC